MVQEDRLAIRTINETMKKEKYEKWYDNLAEYKEELLTNYIETCQRIMNIIHDKILIHDLDLETKVFFLRLVADFSRYKAEQYKEDKKEAAIQKCVKFYVEAL